MLSDAKPGISGSQNEKIAIHPRSGPQRQGALAQVLEATFGQERSSSAAATTSDMMQEEGICENRHLTSLVDV